LNNDITIAVENLFCIAGTILEFWEELMVKDLFSIIQMPIELVVVEKFFLL
jgi:hypothetical protein